MLDGYKSNNRKDEVMDGTIRFRDVEEMAHFLSEFDSTATFFAYWCDGEWILEFTGGM